MALIALVFTFLSIRETNAGLQISQQQQITSEQGQITDRYNAAITNLGSSSIDVRLGGIYALQRIMQDSPRDQPTVVAVLCAFVRDNAPRPRAKSSAPGKPRTDVQAALTVVVSRDSANDGSRTVVDLAGTELSGAYLINADLRYADLTGADLHNAVLESAALNSTLLLDADLTGASLFGADAKDALMEGANFSGAVLSHANLVAADLTHARLAGADLTHADLSDANLPSADLTHANLAGADLFSAVLTHADLTGAHLTAADFTDANTSGATFKGDDLSHVRGLPGTPTPQASIPGVGLWLRSCRPLVTGVRTTPPAPATRSG